MRHSGNIVITFALLASLGGLAACNSSTSALKSKETAGTSVKQNAEAAKTDTDANAGADGQTSVAAENADKTKNPLEVANVIRQPGKVTNRGGYVKIIVNNQPITNYDIQRRAKFLQLRRVGGNRTKKAEQEMIEQTIKLQEAKGRRTIADDTMVNNAFNSFAKRNRATPQRMASQLNQLGVGADHFKEFIRTQISWQRTVQGKFHAETQQKSERDVVTQLRKSGSAKPEVTEYNLKQVIFVVPENKRSSSLLAARKSEAQAYRQRFTSCAETVQQAKALRDVSVVDQKRVMEPELPENWKDEVASLSKNGLTRPKQTGRGIEIMIVCDKRIVSDDRAAQITSQSADFDSFNTKGDSLGKEYLESLLKRSTIVYR